MLTGELVAGLWGVAVVLVQIAGICYAIQAIMSARTPQSAMGWGIALVVLPVIAIPLFWVFGESRFQGYTRAGTGVSSPLDRAAEELKSAMGAFVEPLSAKYADAERISRSHGGIPSTGGNAVRLLVDGQAAFDAIIGAIDEATESIVVQFYIIHDDGLGGRLGDAVVRAAGRGVRCRVLFDAVGSKGIGERWVGRLRAAGAAVHPFVTNRQRGRRFQINFRNHRKLVVVDGRVGFVGGINAGDEYLGLGPLGEWRDTHVRVEGPAVAGMLVPFLEDWNYVTHEVVTVRARPEARGDRRVLPFASSPAQPWPMAPAIYQEILHDAVERIWIASPYFVPDPATRTALAHAAMRGVDVRILLPGKPDHKMPWLSAYTFYTQMREAGVRIWRHGRGFMHQKVLLADDDLAIVGSVNLDYRSFMINFESAVLCESRRFAAEVAGMLEADFAAAREEDLRIFERGTFLFRLKCRVASLMSPEQ